MISFKVTTTESNTITKIIDRIESEFPNANYERVTALMDLTATHANGCKLDFNGLLKADALNFSHDVFGIARHIDRSTGKLTDCFLPRYSL